MTKKGTKRKRAPPTKGPCEHGVKYRSQCRCATLVAREVAYCRSAVGLKSAAPSSALSVKGAVGLRSACTVVYALHVECGGSQICEHGRQRSQCKVRWKLICSTSSAP